MRQEVKEDEGQHISKSDKQDLCEPAVCSQFYQLYSMQHLPTELLTEIYSYLPFDDIVNLPIHLTSRADLNLEYEYELDASLEKKALQRTVRISINPSLAHLVKKITFSTKKPGFINSKDFLKRAWKEHVLRRNKSPSLATQKNRTSRDHEGGPAGKWKMTSKAPENLTFENFHELVDVTESKYLYCHDEGLND